MHEQAIERTAQPQRRPQGWLDALLALGVLLSVILLAGLYAGSLLRIGWIPSDEGTLATSALRVYQGQLPQRDFAEIYTGGLSLYHALAFRLLGVDLFSLRLAVFAVFLVWLPAVYWIARRFADPLWAALITLTAVVWSYPNYVAAMPSWYNLFLATFGTAAALRYLETRARRWLMLAGLCAGASVLVKIVGLYFVAAVLLSLLYLEQSSAQSSVQSGEPAQPCRLYRAACALALLAFLAVLGTLVLRGGGLAEAYHFLLPSAACVGLLLWRERRPSALTSGDRFAALLRLAAPFLLGLFAIVLLFLLPYIASHSLGALVEGVAGSAGARVAGLAGRNHVPSLALACYGLATIEAIVLALFGDRIWRNLPALVTAAALAAALAWYILPPTRQDLWYTAGTLTPLAVLLGAVLLALPARSRNLNDLNPDDPNLNDPNPDRLPRERAMLLIAVAALCSLVQFPVPYITYFCYTAPLTLLAVAAVAALRRNAPGRPALAVLLLGFLGLGLLGMVPRHMYNPDLDLRALHPLTLPRAGGLRIDATTPGYETLVPFLQAHSPNGLLYAANDCPVLYFLSGLRDPTRDDTGAPEAEVLTALHSGQLRLVVFNDRPFFARSAISPALRAETQRLLPNNKTIGQFSVYWR